MINKFDRIAGIIVLVLFFLCAAIGAKAQNVVLQGDTFIQQTTTVGDSTSTGYYYQDSKGFKYPVFLSSKGKAYAWVKSQKSGKMYKKYLPKVTEMIVNMKKNSK